MSSINGCDRFEWLLSALAEDDAAAQAHLIDCTACRAAWTDTETMLAEIAVGLPLGAAPDLRAAVAARIAATPPARVRRANWLPYAAAAALVIGAATLPLNWRGGGSAFDSAARFAAVASASGARPTAPASLTATAATYDFEDALIAGAADTDEESATLESRLFTGTAAGLPDLN